MFIRYRLVERQEKLFGKLSVTFPYIEWKVVEVTKENAYKNKKCE